MKGIFVVGALKRTAARLVETLRSRLGRFVKAHIIDADPWDDESHAATRYREAGR